MIHLEFEECVFWIIFVPLSFLGSVQWISAAMSGGVNLKAISQPQNDAGGSSSLPLPRSMMPLSKMNPSSPTVAYQHGTKRSDSHSSSSVSSGPTELLRGAAFKNLLQPNTGIFSQRCPAATERTNGTRSAYSSPRVPKKEVLRSKDTLDLRTSTLTQRALRDLQLRRSTNKNWTFGKSRLRSVDNADDVEAFERGSANVGIGHEKGHLLYAKGANGNNILGMSSSGAGNFQKERRNTSNQGALEVSSTKSKSLYQPFNMPRRGSEPGRVNMATVAPFGFRWVHTITWWKTMGTPELDSSSFLIIGCYLQVSGPRRHGSHSGWCQWLFLWLHGGLLRWSWWVFQTLYPPTKESTECISLHHWDVSKICLPFSQHLRIIKIVIHLIPFFVYFQFTSILFYSAITPSQVQLSWWILHSEQYYYLWVLDP